LCFSSTPSICPILFRCLPSFSPPAQVTKWKPRLSRMRAVVAVLLDLLFASPPPPFSARGGRSRLMPVPFPLLCSLFLASFCAATLITSPQKIPLVPPPTLVMMPVALSGFPPLADSSTAWLDRQTDCWSPRSSSSQFRSFALPFFGRKPRSRFW